MNCNCNNNNAMKEAKIKHVFGNVLRMAIPLTLRMVELVEVEVDGETKQQAEVTDTDFIPSSAYPVLVVFSKGAVKVSLKAQMRDGNVAYVEDKGSIPVGLYDITVTCNDDNGNPYRFKQNTTLHVVDTTAEAGIVTPIEYEVTTWYLDAAIFLALKGEDGVGIEDIDTQSSSEVGGVNTVTFILTDGRTKSFTIMNGSGSVDTEFSETSQHPLSNQAITERFNAVDQSIADIFGDVDYDSANKNIRFWNKGKTKVLATLDARPFIKDGMVNSVYISNNTLVITFNTDSGREAIGVPLTSVFNPNNYYNKTQVDNRIASAISNINITNYYTKSQTDSRIAEAVDNISIDLSEVMTKDAYLGLDGRLKGDYSTQIVLYYMGEPYDEGITTTVQPYQPIFDNGYIRYSTGSSVVTLGQPQPHIVYCNAKTDKLYRWNGSGFTPVGGGSSDGGYEPPVGGIPKSDLASNVQASLNKADTALQSSDLNGYATTDDVDDAVAALVSSAPQTLDTLKELADALGDDPNFATTIATQLGDKVDKETGKGLSTNDYTTAEKTKLAGIAAGAEVNVQADWNQTTTTAVDYIKNKPTIPAAQVQADWNQTTTTAPDYIKNKPTIPAAQIQADWNQTNTSAKDFIKNKPTIPDVSNLATKTELNNKQDVISDLAAIRSGAAAGATAAQPSDLPTKVSDLTNDAGYTTNTGTVTGISVNGGATQSPTNGVVNLTIGTGGPNDIVGVSDGTVADGAVVFTKRNGDTITLNLNHVHPQYLKYELLVDEAAYNALTTKDSSTLYLIPES